MVHRERLLSADDASLATIAERYIAGQHDGAGTWDDGSTIFTDGTKPQLELKVTDLVGTDHDGPWRCIEVYHQGRLVVKLYYAHHTYRLIMTD